MYNQKPLLGTLIKWEHPLSKGLVGAWLLNENSGNKIFDLSGNNNHGIFGAGAAAPTWKSGRIGSALDFSTGDYVDCGSRSSVSNITDAITISMWICPNTLTGDHFIVYRHTTGSNAGGSIRQHGTYIQVIINIGGVYSIFTSSSNPLTINNWYHIVYTYNGSVEKIYCNNIEIGTRDNSGVIYTPVPQTYISSTSPSFSGTIDDVRIYNRALNASERWQLYVDPYYMFAQPMGAELMYAAPPVGVMSPYYYESLMAGAVI